MPSNWGKKSWHRHHRRQKRKKTSSKCWWNQSKLLHAIKCIQKTLTSSSLVSKNEKKKFKTIPLHQTLNRIGTHLYCFDQYMANNFKTLGNKHEKVLWQSRNGDIWYMATNGYEHCMNHTSTWNAFRSCMYKQQTQNIRMSIFDMIHCFIFWKRKKTKLKPKKKKKTRQTRTVHSLSWMRLAGRASQTSNKSFMESLRSLPTGVTFPGTGGGGEGGEDWIHLLVPLAQTPNLSGREVKIATTYLCHAQCDQLFIHASSICFQNEHGQNPVPCNHHPPEHLEHV